MRFWFCETLALVCLLWIFDASSCGDGLKITIDGVDHTIMLGHRGAKPIPAIGQGGF